MVVAEIMQPLQCRQPCCWRGVMGILPAVETVLACELLRRVPRHDSNPKGLLSGPEAHRTYTGLGGGYLEARECYD